MGIPLVLAAMLPLSAVARATAPNLAGFCAGCQNITGVPPLVGQPNEARLRTLKYYKNWKWPATVMRQLAKGRTYSQFELIAAFFAAQKKEG